MNPDLPNDLSPNRVKRTLHRTFYSLRIRNFRLYFFGQLISNTGNWLTNIALTLLVLKLTKSGLDVGLLAACQYGPILFLTLWGGAIADRVNKRKMLMLTQSLEMMESAGLAVLAFIPHPPIYGLFLLALAGGIFLAFDNPLRRSFVSEMVPRDDIPNAVILYSTIVNTSRIFGPLIAGALVVSVGYGWCFAIDAMSYLAVLVSLLRMNPMQLFTVQRLTQRKGEIKAGIKYILSIPVLWIDMAMLAVVGVLAYNFNITLPIFVTRSLHGSAVSYTAIYSFFSIGAVVTSLLIAHRSKITMKNVISGSLALGIFMLVLGMAPGVYYALPTALFLGMAGVLFTTSTTSIVQLESNAGMRGRVLSVQTVFLVGSNAVGGPILGWIADQFGARVPIFIGAIACIIAASFGYLMSTRLSITNPNLKTEI